MPMEKQDLPMPLDNITLVKSLLIEIFKAKIKSKKTIKKSEPQLIYQWTLFWEHFAIIKVDLLNIHILQYNVYFCTN